MKKTVFFAFLTLFFLFPKSAFAVGEFVTTWKTDNSGVSTASQITIPTHPDETYNYTVDWGDASSNVGVTGSITHTYASPGTYTVTISGTFPRIYFNNGGDKNKILSVEAWGTIAWTSMANAFYGASNLVVNALDGPDLTLVTDMSNMFKNAVMANPSLAVWDMTNIITTSGMFEGAASFDDGGILFWFAPAVTDMSNMFKNATSFNQSIGSVFDVSNVTNMSSMFEGATSFNQDLSTWDTSSVTDMSNMFKNATSFNQPISNWSMLSVLDMSSMFEGATSFNQDLSTFSTILNQNMSNMFKNATAFNQDISAWDVTNVQSTSGMFEGATSFNQPLNSWNFLNNINTSNMFKGATAFDQPLGMWDVDAVTNMSSMFDDATSFDQDIGDWDVINVTNMADMFDGVTLSTANYDALLADWSALALESGVTFDGGNSAYCASIAERASIISTYGWTITDGGTTCSTQGGSGGSSSSSAQNRAQNLLAMGNTQAAEALMKQFPNQFPAPVPFSVRNLKKGMRGDDVRALQQLLVTQSSGIAARMLAMNGTTNYFGPLTQKALAEYQRMGGITPSVGYFGPVTRSAMKMSGVAGLWW